MKEFKITKLEMVLFSIIIPTYNSESTIKNCIDSILEQSYTEYEIWIIDGLSTDNTINIINSYTDNKIKFLSEKDTGVYDAMNKGIKLSVGKWLYFLGSDDTFYNSEVLNNMAVEIKKNDCDLIYGDAYFTDKKYFHDGEFTREKLTNDKNICHQAIFYKKILFERLGLYNISFPINGDWDFNIRCFSTPDLNIKYIPLPIARYNDLTGLSSNGKNRDTNFHKISKAYANKQITISENYIKELEKKIINIYNSKDFRLGNFILNHLRNIKQFFR